MMTAAFGSYIEGCICPVCCVNVSQATLTEVFGYPD